MKLLACLDPFMEMFMNMTMTSIEVYEKIICTVFFISTNYSRYSKNEKTKSVDMWNLKDLPQKAFN